MNEQELLSKLGFGKISVVPYPLEMRYLNDGSSRVMYCPTDLFIEHRGEYGWSLLAHDTLLVDCKPFNIVYEVASALLRKL